MTDTGLKGHLYQAQSSSRSPGVLHVDDRGALFVNGEEQSCGTLTELRIPPRVGNSARFIPLPDGRGFETSDNEQLDALLQQHGGGPSNRPHYLEKSLKFIAFSVLGTMAVVYLLVTLGIPAAADYGARHVPQEIRMEIGAATLRQLDQQWLTPSTLPQSRQEELQDLFQDLLRDIASSLRQPLVFRAGNVIGANALALPDGTVVITDELIDLAENDLQIAAVLLHELGHVEADHGLRSVLRQAGLSLFVLLAAGDIATTSSLLIMVPTALLSLQYTRDFEREADEFALEKMLALKLDPLAFAEMMRLMDASLKGQEEEQQEGQDDDEESGIWSYLSSHPATPERIKLFEDARGP